MDSRVINSIVAAALTALIGVFPLIVRSGRLIRLFAASNISLALWNLGDSFVYLPDSHQAVVWMFRWNYVAGVFVVWCYFRFMFEFSKIRLSEVDSAWKGILSSGLILIALSPTPLLVNDIDRSVRPFKEIPGPLYPLFVGFLLWGLGYALYKFFQRFRVAEGRDRLQLKFMLVALYFVFAEAIIFFISVYMHKLPPVYFYLQVVYGLIVAYSILAHRLMDISIIVRKTLVYSAVMGCLGCIYLSMVAASAVLFDGMTGKQTVFSSGLAASLIVFVFHPLRKRVQEFVDRKFFRQYVDREEKLYELSRDVVTHATPEAMGDALLRVIAETLHPKSAALYLKSSQGTGYARVAATGGGELPPDMNDENPLASYFVDHSQPFVLDPSGEIGEARSTRNIPSAARAA